MDSFDVRLIFISTTYEGLKQQRGECLSVKHILTGGDMIDIFPVAGWLQIDY